MSLSGSARLNPCPEIHLLGRLARIRLHPGMLLFLLVPAYLILAAVLPPADDEIYYWCWSQNLQLSYYDHPPMTAYMIRVGTVLFGDTLFAIRLPAVVSTLTVLAVVYHLTRPRTLIPWVVATPLFTIGAVLVTPDTPLLMFWALYLAWLVEIHGRLAVPTIGPSPRFGVPVWLWLVGGVILGCGILGKYTTGLAVIGGFFSFATAGRWRRWVAGYAVHMGVAFVVTLPILIHNIRHDFIPLRYQWGHSMASSEPGLRSFAEFVGIQILLFGFLPLATFVWSLAKVRSLRRDPRLWACLWLFTFPFAFFLYKAVRGRLEGNWALACYIGVWPLAAAWMASLARKRLWRILTAAAFLPPIIAVVLLSAHLIEPIDALSPWQDRITRQSVKVEAARSLARSLPSYGPPAPVFLTNYQWTALLRFQGIDARQIDGISRPSHFTQQPDRPADHDRVYVFAEGFLPAEFVPGFEIMKIIDRYPLVVRGEEVSVLWLLEYARR